LEKRFLKDIFWTKFEPCGSPHDPANIEKFTLIHALLKIAAMLLQQSCEAHRADHQQG
jgi:hypothetical protein